MPDAEASFGEEKSPVAKGFPKAVASHRTPKDRFAIKKRNLRARRPHHKHRCEATSLAHGLKAVLPGLKPVASTRLLWFGGFAGAEEGRILGEWVAPDVMIEPVEIGLG